MVGFCHLTDSHHNHHGQKPTMVGICHGGNMLGIHDDDDDDDDDDDIVTKYGYGMTKRVTIFIETIRSMIFGITWLSGPNTWRIYSS